MLPCLVCKTSCHPCLHWLSVIGRVGVLTYPKPRGGDRKNGVRGTSRPYFCECGVIRFVLQQDPEHSKSPFKKTTNPKYGYRKSENHTQPTPRSNRSTVRSLQRKTSPWHPHDVFLPIATLHLDLALWYPALAAASSSSSAFHWTKLILAHAGGWGFGCGGAPSPAAPRPWPSCSPDAQFCAFERTTCWVK